MTAFEKVRLGLTIFAAVGSGLMGGLFFVFSVAVMKALSSIPANQGMAAMQAINRVIVNPLFLSVFMGTAAACGILAGMSFMQIRSVPAICILVASLSYLAGTIFVTAVFNVPKNNALDLITPDNPAIASLWSDYIASWTAWNHVRTLSCLGAASLFTVALRLL